MKFNLKRRFRDWLYDDSDNEVFATASDSHQSDDLEINHDNAIHFAVLPANGGRIVQIRYYDRVKDRNLTKLHVITPDEDLAESLAHILQIEVISR
jgi:hypothetical protein